MHILAELTPLDPVTGSRVTLRVASAEDRTITGLNGQIWRPAITSMPTLSMQLFDGDFTSSIEPGGASFALAERELAAQSANARRFVWAGAGLKLYAGASGQAWPWSQVFEGKAESFERESGKLRLTAKVDLAPFKKDVLVSRYAGTGGAEGGADLKNKPKPYLAGRARTVEPVLIDATNSVFQFHGYGPIQAVQALYERASSFGASIGDVASYAALVAASIPPGRWGTCLAEGLIRLGAPPYGLITGDVDGDRPGGSWIRRTGAIISRLASLAGVAAGSIDSASLAALDTAVPRNINIYLTEQTTVLDIAQRLARGCNAQAGVSLLGKLFACRVAIGSPVVILNAQGRALPPVVRCTESDVSPPYARIEMGAARCWRPHRFDEIAFTATLVDRGTYSASATYREGNIVQDQGSSWIYINPTPTAGNAPPALPTTSNTFWKVLAAQGASGVSPPLIKLSGSHNSFRFSGAGVPLSQSTAITATRQNTPGTTQWRLLRADGVQLTDWNSATELLGNGACSTVISNDQITIGEGLFAAITASQGTPGLIYEARISSSPTIVDRWSLTRVSDGAAGAPGEDGIDGIDGADGKLVEFVWRRAPTIPATPTGNGIPAGWSDDPPTGTDPLWMSKAKQELDGTLVAGESWSTPVRHDGPPGADGANGAPGAPGAPGTNGTDGFTIAPASAAFSIACTSDGTPKAGEFNKVITFVLRQGSGPDLAGDAATSFSAPTIVGCTAALSGTRGQTLTISAISADSAYVDVVASRSGTPVATVRVTLTKAKDGVSPSPQYAGVQITDGITLHPDKIVLTPGQSITAEALYRTLGDTVAGTGNSLQVQIRPAGGAWSVMTNGSNTQSNGPGDPVTLGVGAATFTNVSGVTQSYELRTVISNLGGGTERPEFSFLRPYA